MKNKKEVFVLYLPNVGDEDIIKLTEQLILQSENRMDVYKVENNNLVIEIIIKKG